MGLLGSGYSVGLVAPNDGVYLVGGVTGWVAVAWWVELDGRWCL